MSKTDMERFLRATPGWWNDPKWGVRKDRKAFRLWSNKLWAVEKRKLGPSRGHTRKQAEAWERRILISPPTQSGAA
jgi:hypothetical protein